jgi:hypothetical protein
MFLILSVNRMIPVPDVTNSFPEYLTFYVCQRFNGCNGGAAYFP